MIYLWKDVIPLALEIYVDFWDLDPELMSASFFKDLLGRGEGFMTVA